MKTKRTRLAPIVEKILMARGSGHKITSSVRYRSGVTESGTTRVVRKEVVLLEKNTIAANVSSAKHQRYYPYRAFLLLLFIFPFVVVHQLQKADSYFIAIFAPDTVE